MMLLLLFSINKFLICIPPSDFLRGVFAWVKKIKIQHRTHEKQASERNTMRICNLI